MLFYSFSLYFLWFYHYGFLTFLNMSEMHDLRGLGIHTRHKQANVKRITINKSVGLQAMACNFTDSQVNMLCFDKICRTCLSEGDMKSVFSESSVNDVKLVEMLSCCSMLEISEQDNYPLQMCADCISELCVAYNFKQKCQQSEKTLQYYSNLPKHNIKDELCEEVDHCQAESEAETGKTPALKNGITGRKTRAKIKPEKNSDSNDSDKCDSAKDPAIKQQTDLIHKCKRCSESFMSVQELVEHRKTTKHPSKRDHKCSECDKQFTYSQLKIHMRTHTREKPYSCQVCGQCFSLNCNLQRHLLIHSGERPFKCNECGKAFTQSSTLSQHLQTHSGRGKSYLCSYCGQSFTGMAGLRSHSKIHTGVRPYPCTVCEKSFTHIGTLKSHMLIHTGQKPFVCSVCGRAFTQRNHLRYHLRTHSGERPFECSLCGKTFSLKGNLTVHMRTHTGETPYHCPVCDKGFYDSSSMNKHRKGHVSAVLQSNF